MRSSLHSFKCDLLKFSSPTSLKPPSPILESFHPLAIFGQILGFFPIQNVFVGFSSVSNFKFKLVSYACLYSLVLNLVFYSLAFEATWDYWMKRRHVFKFSTDAFAIQIFLAVYLFLRFTLHLLCILRAPKVLECLKHLESYDEFFNFPNKTRLVNRYFLIYLLGTTVNIAGNICASFPEVKRVIHVNFQSNSKYIIFSIIPSPEALFAVVYGIHIVAETALFFSHCCSAYIITGICDRVTAIRDEVNDIGKDRKYSFFEDPQPIPFERSGRKSSTLAFWINQIHAMPVSRQGKMSVGNNFEDLKLNNMGLGCYFDTTKKVSSCSEREEEELTKRLKALCNQYFALVDISKLLNEFAKETMAVFTAGSAVMLVALSYLISILLTQYVPTRSNRIKESSELVPIVFIATITFLRLLNFINIGEKLRSDGLELNAAVHRLYSSKLEASAVILYFQRVTSSLKLALSAGGFFVVRRTVVTSILGPVVTFIVILAQFRAADLQLHYNSNGTMQH